MKTQESKIKTKATEYIEEIQERLVYLYNIIRVQDARIERLQEKALSVEEKKTKE